LYRIAHLDKRAPALVSSRTGHSGLFPESDAAKPRSRRWRDLGITRCHLIIDREEVTVAKYILN
jgi:hypothetical protein